MNHQALSSFIGSVADLLRGDCKQSEYGKVILPFTQTMSKQALDSEKIRARLKDILLGPAKLYEALRGQAK